MTTLEKKSQIITSEDARDWLIEYFWTTAFDNVRKADHLIASAWAAGFKLVPLDEDDLDGNRG